MPQDAGSVPIGPGILAHKSNPAAAGLTPARLRRVLDHIETHLGEDMAQRRLAAIAQLSLDHFARLFRQSTGLPPHRYVLQRRIDRARHLMADRRLSLAEIGYALGFPSQAHFTTMFRRWVGTTPGAYRGTICGTASGAVISDNLSTKQRKNGRRHLPVCAITKNVSLTCHRERAEYHLEQA
jgi:AraC-like DNA-binding protein